MFKRDIKELEKSVEDFCFLITAMQHLLINLVGLNDSRVDALLDKYEVKIAGKYPRGLR